MTEVQGNMEGIECVRMALPPAACPTVEHIPPHNMPGSAGLENERLCLETEIHSLAYHCTADVLGEP